MKKLMIAAAIVCAAVVSQASTIQWSSTAVSGADIYGPDKTTKISVWAAQEGYTISSAILVNAADLTQSDMLKGLREGTYTFGGKSLDSTSVASSKIAKKTTDELPALAAKDVSVYYAILATDGDGNKSVLISTLKDVSVPAAEGAYGTASWGTAGKIFSQNNYGDAAFGSAGWYSASAVPEPTSGLLLLLGVAGLALRRRRA